MRPFQTDLNPIMDYVSSEEAAQENRQKTEAEKQTVHEAKMELNKHQKISEDMSS